MSETQTDVSVRRITLFGFVDLEHFDGVPTSMVAPKAWFGKGNFYEGYTPSHFVVVSDGTTEIPGIQSRLERWVQAGTSLNEWLGKLGLRLVSFRDSHDPAKTLTTIADDMTV